MQERWVVQVGWSSLYKWDDVGRRGDSDTVVQVRWFFLIRQSR